MDEIYFNEYKKSIYKIVNNPRPNMPRLFRSRAEYALTLKPRVNIHELLLD
jgi:hypothetical protein